MPGELVDGNDAAQVYATVRAALDAARARRRPDADRGASPTASRRTPTPTTPPATASNDEVQPWLARDPLARLETYLRASGALDDAGAAAVAAEAERFADRRAHPDERRRRSPTRTTCSPTSTPRRPPRAAAPARRRCADGARPMTDVLDAPDRASQTGDDGRRAEPRARRRAGRRPVRARLRRGRRHARRRLPGHRRAGQAVRRRRGCSTPRSPRPASSAPRSAWR